ncbi:MAG: sodium-dependent transporter [Planctomycetota bacterium]
MTRAHWGTRFGFVLAAAGSAVGLGNIWKFPYIAGQNGGGAFVLVYLVFVATIGLPIMVAEVMIGRTTQKSPIGAFRELAGRRSPWTLVGALGVLAAFLVLSYYAVVAGWAMHYTVLSARGAFAGEDPAASAAVFGETAGSSGISIGWHLAFMALTVWVVMGGVQKGIERASRILMPLLFLMLLVLLGKAFFTEGFGKAGDFVFGSHTDKLTTAGVLEALGHSFFTLSLGLGGMLTYGSYLDRKADLLRGSIAITVLDTVVALLACMILFPITFSYGMEPAAGPGLVFVNMPVALGQMPGGSAFAVIFFGLVVFAALTSSISILEVVASYLIDERGWTRRRAAISAGVAIAIFGIPSALSGSTHLFGEGVGSWSRGVFGESVTSWFDVVDHLVSNWMLPLGGMGIALFCAWRIPEGRRFEEFNRTRRLVNAYRAWMFFLRFLVPVAIAAVFLNKLGLLDRFV